MNKRQSRLQQEQTTLEHTIQIYCAGRHGSRHSLCPECQELRAYAFLRLEGCPFGEDKGTCSKCPIHCYNADMRQKIRLVMRYAGPRMLYKHPILALRHLRDAFRRFPKLR